ncbi:hypothetical protein P3T40_004775 [Paraburkholderia sp. EB58]|uniref:hypothetical protein n=1 Tax=Paraburkholderia sp. EB58 TaxID=3035125 RepID=UPI003D256E91
MLFLPLHDVESTTAQLTEARPLINDLAHDPSLTGLANLLTSTLLLPLEIGRVKLSGLAPLLDHSATVLDRVQENQHAPLSWRAVADPSTTLPARSFIFVQAVLDYASLKAGGSATELIRKTGTSLNLEAKYGVHIHLTGQQPPLADDEFASVQQGAAFNGIFMFLVVLGILWLAFRSAKLVLDSTAAG